MRGSVPIRRRSFNDRLLETMPVPPAERQQLLELARSEGTAASDARSTLARTRAPAVASARERDVTFVLSRGEFGVDNEVVRLLPETIRLGAVLPGGDRLDRGSVRVRFFPDGGGEEAEVTVTARDGGALRVAGFSPAPLDEKSAAGGGE